jgi:hypothetical protein
MWTQFDHFLERLSVPFYRSDMFVYSIAKINIEGFFSLYQA